MPVEELERRVVQAIEEPQVVNFEIRKAVRHGMVYGIGNVLTKALGFLMLPFYTHYLNPTDYGILEILDLVISLFGMFLNMGMTAALVRCYASAESAKEKRKVVGTAFLFVVATGAITFCAALRSIKPVSALLFGPGVPSMYLLLSFSSFILAYIANLPRTYLLAKEASATFTIIDFSTVFVQLTLNVIFIAVMKIGLLGIVLSSLFVVAIQVVLLSGWLLRRVGINFSYARLKELIHFGLPLVFSNLALFTLNFSDRFFLQHLRSLDEVGIYAVGYKFGFMMNFVLVQPFYIMWQSRMYPIHAQPNHAKTFRQIFVLYSMLLLFCGLALSMFSAEVVQVMADRKFSASYRVIPVVTLAYMFYGIGYYVQLGMFLTSKTKLIGVISSAAILMNLLLNYVLISHYGMMGAAWATFVSFFAIAVGSYWGSQRVFPLSLGVGRVAAGMGLGIGFYLISYWVHPASFGLTLLMKGLLLCGFPVLVWKAKVLVQDEIDLVISAKNNALVLASRFLGKRLSEAVGA